MLSVPREDLCQSNRPIVLMLYSNDATDMDTLIRFSASDSLLNFPYLSWSKFVNTHFHFHSVVV